MKTTIFVECIGFADWPQQELEAAFRIRLLSYQSNHFDFRCCDVTDNWQSGVPSISIIAVSARHKWPKVLSNVVAARSRAIALFGPERPILGLPVIKSLANPDELILLAGLGDEYVSGGSSIGAYLPDFNPTIPAAV